MTTYALPKTDWAHGDFPVAAELNKLSTAQTHINELNYASARVDLVPYNTVDDTVWRYTFTHRKRYLYYLTDGSQAAVLPYAATYSAPTTWNSPSWRSANGTSLSGSVGNLDDIDGGVQVFDLDSLDWLQYGERYVVYDVWGAMEVDIAEPLQLQGSVFADDNFLSAAMLNALGEDVAGLKALTDSPNPPQIHWIGGGDSEGWYWMKRTRDYLHIKGKVTSGDIESIEVFVSTNPSSMGTALLESNNGGSGYTSGDEYHGTIDISALTADNDYIVRVGVTEDSGGGDFSITGAYLSNA